MKSNNYLFGLSHETEIYLLHLLILMIRPDFAETYNWIRFLLIAIFCSLGILYHKVMQSVVANVVKR